MTRFLWFRPKPQKINHRAAEVAHRELPRAGVFLGFRAKLADVLAGNLRFVARVPPSAKATRCGQYAEQQTVDDMFGRASVSRQDHPNPSALPVQKVRLRYAKRGRLRFTSHRDIARVFERALRRCGVPMAYSQGFSPRPKVSWSGAVPTGVSSEAEYVELQLAQQVDPEQLRVELDAVLPPGVDVLEAVEAGPGALAERLEVSRWRIELPGVDSSELAAAVSNLMAAESVEVERMTKDGRRTFDARAAVVSAEASGGVVSGDQATPQSDQNCSGIARVDDWPTGSGPYGILVTVVRQTTPVVRPDDVLSALRVVAGLVPSDAARATRLEQGRLDDAGGLTDPLAQDRAAAEARRGEPASG